MRWTVLLTALYCILLLSVSVGAVNTARYLNVEATNSSGSDNAIGTYNLTNPGIYSITPPAGQVWYIHRLLVHYEDVGAFDSDSYGNNIVLTNGIRILTNQSGTVTNLTYDNVKYNAEWGEYSYDVALSNYGTGNEFLSARWSFDRAGTVIRLDGDQGDSIQVLLQDDLSGLVGQTFTFQGYVGPNTEDELVILPIMIMLATMLVLLTVGVYVTRSLMTKLLLLLPINIVVILIITMARLGIEAARPDLTSVLSLLNVMYTSTVVLFFPLLVISFWIAIKSIATWLLDPRAKRDREWDD